MSAFVMVAATLVTAWASRPAPSLTSDPAPGVEAPDQELAGGSVEKVLVTPVGPTKICAWASRAAANKAARRTNLGRAEDFTAAFMLALVEWRKLHPLSILRQCE